LYFFLPIAGLPISILFVLALGMVGGILAGMFGIGGGFIVTPLLIFNGVPPAIAVATSANQIIASSVSGFIAHWRRKKVDIKMGLCLLAGGLVGSFLGILLFKLLQQIGQIDLAISVSYVLLLSFVGISMAIESARAILATPVKRHTSSRLEKFRKLPLPFQMHFPQSELTISVIIPLAVGLIAGAMVSLMGIGGGFIMIPAMLYLIGMPMRVVIGTSLFQIIFTTSLTTYMHAVKTQSVDIVLAVLLIAGGVIGVQMGTWLASKIAPDKLRGLLALLILSVCFKLAFNLFLQPENLFSVERVM
jgi:uncharacterized protein